MAREASDIRTLRQRISTGPSRRRPAPQAESLDHASQPWFSTLPAASTVE
jgi:hypothetical protein